jgi:branched-chain amino acid transport system permease protein
MKTWQRHSGIIIPILVIAALAIWPAITGKVANQERAFTILKAIALASSLNILLGYTGYVSFGHIVFYGFGGYVGLYLLTEQGWSLWAAMLAGGLASRRPDTVGNGRFRRRPTPARRVAGTDTSVA